MLMKIMKGSNNRCWILLFFILLACTSKDKKTTTTEIKRIHTPEGTFRTRSVTQYTDQINYTASILPLTYYIRKTEKNISTKNLQSILEQNKHEKIIEFYFKNEENKNLLKSEFTQMDEKSMTEYIAFKIQEDFYLKTKKNQKIPCLGVHFERNFNVAPYQKLLLYFSNVPIEEEVQLVYSDQLFKNGILKFNLIPPSQ